MIEIKNLTAGYNQKVVVSRLSFRLEQEQTPLIIVGKNGCGKSTLLKSILGFLPYTGFVSLSKSNFHKAWLPQNFSIGLPLPVLDFVALGRPSQKSIFPSLEATSKDAALEALRKLNLSHLADKYTHEISAGEWQLVALAQLMVENADVWVLDEPTSSLDVYYKNAVFHHLWEMALALKKIIILTTHDIPFVPKSHGTFLLLGGANSYTLLPNTPENHTQVLQDLMRSPNPATY